MKALFLAVLLIGCTSGVEKIVREPLPDYPEFAYEDKVCIAKGFFKGACGRITDYDVLNNTYVYEMTADDKRTYKWLRAHELVKK